MNSDPLFLDACVPMYAIGGDHPYRDPCARVLAAVAQRELWVVTDAEMIQEITHRLYAVRRQDEGLRLAARLLELVEERNVLPVTRDDVVHALELLRDCPFLLPRDAVHIAVMQAAGVTRAITADRHFERVPGIERVDPNDVTW